VATSGPTLIDALLEDQRSMTAVERFALQHSHEQFEPAQRYRELLPASPPGPGEQYAFEVDLDRCSGCKACVTACHSLNGLDDNETWREVGLLISPKPHFGRAKVPPVMQHITTACHHCVDPACLNGCPVLAYEKDPITGIVRHLDDQCIGCQYCVLKCPYDVPKYNERLGVVRKCDMCTNRLSVGEPPACAQACPTEAIRITKVASEAVRIEFRERRVEFLAAAPEPAYTLPTTRYLPRKQTSTAPQTLIAADADELRMQPAHWPLVLMLVLSQAALGATWAGLFSDSQKPLLIVAMALAVTSTGASVFHLGRPLGAWRFFLGLRRSWLSREILAFGMFMPVLGLAFFSGVAHVAAAIVGTLAVLCSVMIYHDTHRELWHFKRSAPLFLGSVLLVGASVLLVFNPANPAALPFLVCGVACKLTLEISVLRRVIDLNLTPLKRTALLIADKFKPLAFARLVLLSIGAVLLPLLLSLMPQPSMAIAISATSLVLFAEVIERLLFFRCVQAPKMPGGIS
jgi:formate dehydrogenase iron-sulfur subunit